MTPDISLLLEELYTIDPSLRDHEDTLRPVLAELLAARPDIRPDKKFVQELRGRIREEARRRTAADSAPSAFISPFSFLFMPKFSFAVIGAFLGILVTVPTMYYVGSQKFAPIPGTEMIDGGHIGPAFGYNISQAGSAAFGSLGMIAANQAQGLGGGGPEAISARPQSGGGGDAKMIAPDSRLMYPYYVTDYTYTGDPLTLTDETVNVLRRLKNIQPGGVAGQLMTANLGLLDLSSFGGSKVESFNFYQEAKNGYYINVNMREGMVSINQQWETWDHPESSCQTDACFQQHRVRESDMLGDSEAIAIADAFLAEHGITMPNIGEPMVDSSWRDQYDAVQNKAEYWFPESMTVIYPLVIEGQTVYEEFGNVAGLNVMVGVKSKKVTGVWNLIDQKFESSAYDGVTDAQQVLDFIAAYGKPQGDMMPTDAQVERHTVELGTPSRGYARFYRYENNRSDELYVPALIFPVKTPVDPATGFYDQRSFVVPLAEELLDRPYPSVMPLMREEAVEAVEPEAN